MVVLSTIGNYAGGYMIFSEWNIGGDEKIDAIPTGNPITHKTLNFAYVAPPLIYDFTNFNTLPTWKAEATRIGATYLLNYFDLGGVYQYPDDGYIQLTLPIGYNQLKVNYNNPYTGIINLYIDNVVKQSCPSNSSREYIQLYTPGQVLKIDEQGAVIGENLIITLTNTNYVTNTYTLSVQAGTSIQVNNGTAQYLSGNYTISVGATQSSVVKSGIGQVGSDPYPLTNGSTIAIRYSMLQRITSTINIKKDGLIKYVPASGTNPSTGTWNIIDIDTQPLTQFSGNLPLSRTDGNLPAIRLDNIDMSKVATGTLPITRITGNDEGKIPISLTSGNLPASRLDNIDMGKVATGQLDQSRVNNLYIPITNQFHRIVYAHENIVDTQGIWTNKFRIYTNLHLNQYNQAYSYYQYFLSMSPNNVQDRHKYWFGVVKMSTIGGTDNPANTQWYLLRGDNGTFDIRGTSSTEGVWWLDIWTYTTAYCESLIAILH